MRNLLTLLLVTLVICVLPSFASAQEGVEFVFTTGFYNQYLSPNGQVFHDKNVLQGDLLVVFPKILDGCFVNFWWSFGADGTNLNSDFGDEIDAPIVGCSKQFGPFLVSGVVGWYEVYPLFSTRGGDFVYLQLQADHSFKVWSETLTSYLSSERYVGTHESREASGQITRLGVGWSRELFREKAYVGMDAQVFYDNGAFLNDNGWFSIASVSFGVIRDNLRLGPQLTFITPLTSVSDGRGPEFALSIGASISF